MIGMRMGHVDGRQILLRFEDLGGELVRLAQRELRIDHQHVLLADDHRGVHVVATSPRGRCALSIEVWTARMQNQRPRISSTPLKQSSISATLDFRDDAGAVADFFNLHAGFVQHGQQQIRMRRQLLHSDVPAAFYGSVGASG